MKRAIRTHLKDFIALLVLVVISLAACAYILSKERLRMPWQSSPFVIMCQRLTRIFRATATLALPVIPVRLRMRR